MTHGRKHSHDVAYEALDNDLAISPVAPADERAPNFLETIDGFLDAGESAPRHGDASSYSRVKAFPPAATRLRASVPEVQEPPDLRAKFLTFDDRGWWASVSSASPRLIVVLLAALVIVEASVIALLWRRAPTLDVQGTESMSATNGAGESPTAQSIAAPTTTLRVEGAPDERAVILSTQPEGTTPSAQDIAPGRDVIGLKTSTGVIQRPIRVESGTPASLPTRASPAPQEAPRSVVVTGWLSVASGVPLQILEGDQVIGSTESSRLMIPAGRHQLDLVNESLGFRTRRDVLVAPGKVASLTVDLPNGVVHINASPWAEVWLDERRLGETPLGNIGAPIGPHVVIFRHPEFGVRRGTVTVTLNGIAKVAVDMSR